MGICVCLSTGTFPHTVQLFEPASCSMKRWWRIQATKRERKVVAEMKTEKKKKVKQWEVGTNVSKRKERSDIKQRDNQRKERATEGGYVRGTAISQTCCCSGFEAPSLGVSIATPGDVTSWPSDLVKSISLDVILLVSGSHSHSHTRVKIHTHTKLYTTFTCTVLYVQVHQIRSATVKSEVLLTDKRRLL